MIAVGVCAFPLATSKMKKLCSMLLVLGDHFWCIREYCKENCTFFPATLILRVSFSAALIVGTNSFSTPPRHQEHGYSSSCCCWCFSLFYVIYHHPPPPTSTTCYHYLLPPPTTTYYHLPPPPAGPTGAPLLPLLLLLWYLIHSCSLLYVIYNCVFDLILYLSQPVYF